MRLVIYVPAKNVVEFLLEMRMQCHFWGLVSPVDFGSFYRTILSAVPALKHNERFVIDVEVCDKCCYTTVSVELTGEILEITFFRSKRRKFCHAPYNSMNVRLATKFILVVLDC
ncbi:hypothetical protein CEXT_170661 [Caerostris extrusa]|uniref:Uncharacterized protein n=1 Tax=Caerostris extrusa TaxID=172846 RepID=A0AAV4NWM2_CAEEX|nr:hypothetical protein CEXT_170661 [Caerostris extrusa]